MKKAIKFYSIIWFLALALFNIIVFVTPSDWGNKYEGAFWAGYVFITVVFVAQLFCASFALKDESLTKTFYRIPAVSICYIGLVAMLIAGSISMLLPLIEQWLGIIVCTVVLVINAIAVIKSTTAATIVEVIDEKIAARTAFIKDLTAEVEALSYIASTAELKAEVKKVYEAFRYSDPMDNDSLSEICRQIKAKYSYFSDAVHAQDFDCAKATSAELIALIERRNILCKRYK